jgi:hypothetical protein
MATGEASGPIHPAPTRRSGHRSLFSGKHHGHDPRAARWLPTLSQDEEFAVFDAADFHGLNDERGWLYGVRVGESGGILELGTWGEQVAEFPAARPDEPWHGYPLYPLKEAGPPNRRGEKHRPSKDVFLKMEAAGLLTARDRKRLMKGDHA